MFLHLGTSYLAPGLMRISLFCVSVCHTAPGQSLLHLLPAGRAGDLRLLQQRWVWTTSLHLSQCETHWRPTLITEANLSLPLLCESSVPSSAQVVSSWVTQGVSPTGGWHPGMAISGGRQPVPLARQGG